MLATVGILSIPALAIIQNDECFQIEGCHTYEMKTYRDAVHADENESRPDARERGQRRKQSYKNPSVETRECSSDFRVSQYSIVNTQYSIIYRK